MQALLKGVRWVGGEHDFALNLGALRALQTNRNAGPEQLLLRMVRGEWLVDDVIEILRQGLIGAGMPATEAGPLILGLVDLHPWHEFRITALAVLNQALVGVEGDPVGEKMGGAGNPLANGDFPGSMATAQ